MADAVKKVAAANPNQQFAEVDAARPARTSTACSTTPPRAASSAATWPPPTAKTGKVATFGGLNIPPVTIYMDGFWEGVAVLQQAEGQERPGPRLGRGQAEGGTFAQSFTDQNKGKSISPGVHPAGRRRHLPGRGRHRSGRGCRRAGLAAARSARSGSTPTAASAPPQYCSVFLSSVVKDITKAVTEVRHRRRLRHVPDRLLHRHPAERRHRPRAVPQLRLEGVLRHQERAAASA